MKQLLFELKSHRKSFFFWSLSLLAFIILIMMEFSAYRSNPELLEILEVLPQELLAAFNLIDVNLTTVSGFTSITLDYIQLALAIYASLLGAIIVSKEARWRTSDFLYVMPQSRFRINTIKFIAGFILMTLMVCLVGCVFVLVASQYTPETTYWAYLMRAHLMLWLILTFFYGFGFFLGSVVKSSKLASTIASVSVFVLYILSVFLNLVDSLSWLKPVSIFSFSEYSKLITEHEFSLQTIVTCLGCMILFYVVSIIHFPRKDLGIHR
jgi:ABC-2 type transport system permease protein